MAGGLAHRLREGKRLRGGHDQEERHNEWHAHVFVRKRLR